jgi:hypothetical protein
VPGYVEEELRGYLECGILCFGFGRALCTGCGQGFVIAFSCKGRGVCPSCNGRHMAQTAAHLADHVIPPVPVRQWVISVPKRLRWFLANRPEAIAALTKIFLAEIERCVVMADGDELTLDLLPPALRGDRPAVPMPGRGGDLDSLARDLVEQGMTTAAPGDDNLFDRIVSRVERELIAQMLAACDGVQLKAAARLGINRNTLRKKLLEHGLEDGDDAA